MVEFVNNAETNRITAAVARTLSQQGWAVTATKRAHHPLLQVAKRDISFFIMAIDAGIQSFIGVSRLLDRLEHFAREYRARSGEGIVYVIAHPLDGLDASILPSRGIALFMLNEMHTFTAIESVYEKSFAKVDGRTRAVAKGCKELCLALSKEAANHDDLDEAQRWLELNLDGVSVVIESRYKLIDLLVRNGDPDMAKKIAWDGIELSPNNQVLLGKLRDLEKKTGNMAALPSLDQRIATASRVRPSLKSILANQNAMTGRSVGMGQSPTSREKVGLFRRLFVRST